MTAVADPSAGPGGPVARPGGHGERGRLIVLEGIDGSGRSTHVGLLERHLRYRGLGVARTSLASAVLAGDPIRRAKHERRVDPTALALLYAADLAERVETVIVPSLRAGLVVLADRYAYTPMARAEARGVDGAWLDALFAFAAPPDAVLYLDVPPETALARRERVPGAFEAGLDLDLSADAAESFLLFQGRLAACFDRYAARYGFVRVPATSAVARVHDRISHVVDGLLAPPALGRRAT